MTDDYMNLILTNPTADSPMLTDPYCGSLSLTHLLLWNLIYSMDHILLANALGLCAIPNSI